MRVRELEVDVDVDVEDEGKCIHEKCIENKKVKFKARQVKKDLKCVCVYVCM